MKINIKLAIVVIVGLLFTSGCFGKPNPKDFKVATVIGIQASGDYTTGTNDQVAVTVRNADVFGQAVDFNPKYDVQRLPGTTGGYGHVITFEIEGKRYAIAQDVIPAAPGFKIPARIKGHKVEFLSSNGDVLKADLVGGK